MNKQQEMFSAPTDLDTWLDKDIVNLCTRCGVTLQSHETTDCDDCRRELLVRQQARTAAAVDKGIERAVKSVGKPKWTSDTITLPDPTQMSKVMADAFDRQIDRYGEETQYCNVCRLPSGDWQTCYACKEYPQRTPGECVVCKMPCRAEYSTCYACKLYPTRTLGQCVECGAKCLPHYATCWECKQ